MSQQEKIEAEIAKLSDRRRDMLILPEIDWRVAIFGEIDESSMKMAERVSGQCNSHFDAVKDMLHEMKISQINAMQQNNKLTEQALKGNAANLFAIQALTEELKLHKASLSITASFESAGKNGFSAVKWFSEQMKNFGTFCKERSLAISLIFFSIAIFIGKMDMGAIWKFLLKQLGAE